MHAYNRLKILLWNPQSINNAAKHQLLTHTLVNEQIDVLILVETFLKPTHTFHINNYTIYRNDRIAQAHGGVAIAIRNTIKHKHIPPAITNTIENASIEVSINNTPTTIIAAYSPKYTQFFEHDMQTLIPSNKQFMLFGDLNAKHLSWNCNNNNKAGVKLFTMQQTHDFLVFHTPEHTHHPHSGQSASTIDLLLSNVNFPFELNTHSDQMLSDHVPVVCSTVANVNKTNKVQYDFFRADWRNYRRSVESAMI